MVKAILVFFCIMSLSCIPFSSQAQSEAEAESATVDLEALVQHIDTGIAQLRALGAQIDTVPDADREAVMYRRDERTFALVAKLDELAQGIAQLPAGDPLREETTRRIRDEFADVGDMVLERIHQLSVRIAQFTSELESLSGPSRLALESYLFTLENLRIQAYQSAAGLIEGRSALALPVGGTRQGLLAKIYLHAETLVGHLEFTGAAQKLMQERLKGDPQNAELDAAIKNFSHRHEERLQRLQAITKLLERFDQDSAVYKTVLLRQGQSLSVRDFDSDVFFGLLKQGGASLGQSLIEQMPDMLFRVFIFVLVLVVFRMLSRLIRRGVIAACNRSSVDLSTLLKDVLASVSSGTVMVMGVLIALSQVGISLGPMLAGLGVAGFIVGFALQDTLGNFAAGGMILIYRPYDVDDFIEVTGASGLVKKMSLVSTTITTFDNQTLVVPNSKIWGDVIKNVTAQRLRRVDLEFGIGYGDDIETVERVLRDVIGSHDLILKTPEPLIKLHTLGDSSVNFVVRPWVKTSDYWPVYWDVIREVKMRFDREGISIPFPQTDVHIYNQQA